MFSQLLIAWGLMALCVVVHAIGVSSAVRWLRAPLSGSHPFWRGTALFVGLAGWIVLLHLIEITAWALCYVRAGAMPDLQSALYFSAVTYTTTGYGDLLPPPDWRLVGGIEALTGILMCGWSTGFFFAVVTRMFRADANRVGS
jgi:Ion channel